MNRFPAVIAALVLGAASGCSCAPTGYENGTFDCRSDADCADGFRCERSICTAGTGGAGGSTGGGTGGGATGGGMGGGIGVTVTPTAGLVTTETGGTATFTLALATQPTATVTINLTSDTPTEGTVSPASVTFTTVNWNAPQTVTVTGVDDAALDGPQPYLVVTEAQPSADPNYDSIAVADVAVNNIDDDSAGVTGPTGVLVTTEAGGSAVFTLVLNTAPTADVTIGLTSSDLTEGTVSPASLTFTTVNWNAPQMATVTGVDDAMQDGNVPYTIITVTEASADPNYDRIEVVDVAVANTDNDSAGFTLTPVSGLVTTEAGGTATFTVVLNTQPTANVAIGLTSGDTTEATVSPTSVIFTPVDWGAPQTVTLTGVDDGLIDGNQPYSIVTANAVSTDPAYTGRVVPDVLASNTDDESAGVTVTPTSGLVTTEGGGTATFTIVLNAPPTTTVTIGLTSSDTTEGQVSPASVQFTTVNWNTPRTVTVTGVDDFSPDGNQPFTIVTTNTSSIDVNYNNLPVADVAVSNTDNDSPGITVTPTMGLVTTEAGGTATFTLVLNTLPTASVTIGLVSNNLSEGTVSPSSVVFTTLNWNTPRSVTITGVDDQVQDGNQPYTIVTAAASSTDPTYANLGVTDVAVSNTDNDSAGVTVSPTTGLTTTEAGGTATFTVVLNTQPLASDVTIGLTSNDLTEGRVSPALVTFTTSNWNMPQTVTVTGLEDDLVDGSRPYTIITSHSASADPNYRKVVADVSVTNTDNDQPSVIVTPLGGLVTTEDGGVATFTLVLNSLPTSSVLISLSSGDPSEGSVSPSSVTFTTANWSAPRTVTVTGVDDLTSDGPQTYSIVTANAVSGDVNYSGRPVADVVVVNVDDELAGVTVTPTTGLVTTEAGGTATFTVVLNRAPTANVTIDLTSSDLTEGTVSPATLTFTPADWSTPQTVTLTGVNDALQDFNQSYTINTSSTQSTDSSYSGRFVADVTATNEDSSRVTAAPTAGLLTTEAGGSDTFTLVLGSAPAANVTVDLVTNDPAEGTVSPASLTFTTADWATPKMATVTGVDDVVIDGAKPFTIVTSAVTSTDPNYSGRAVADVAVNNVDNDTAGVTVTPTSGLVTTEAGGTATFTVVLNAQPAADVTIGLTSSDLSEGTVSSASITFTSTNWSTPQTVTVTGVDDALVDGSQPYVIVTSNATSSDANYNGVLVADVAVATTDND